MNNLPKSALHNIIHGDLIEELDKGKIDVVLHIANCMCVMGSGFAKSISSLYPEVLAVDKTTGKGDKSKLGTCSMVTIVTPNGHNVTIVNMYAQYKYGRNDVHLDMVALHSCLEVVNTKFPKRRIAMPRIGAGTAGGNWYEIANTIHTVLCGMDYLIYIYMAVEVVNMNTTKSTFNTVRCDRRTVFGNPYPLPKFTRNESCDKHWVYMVDKLYCRPNKHYIRAMASLYESAKAGGLKLSCHCAPKRCHCEDIRRILYIKFHARVIVAGGRDFNSPALLNTVLTDKLSRFEHAMIISGLAEGADTLGLEYAKTNGIPYKEFPAKWDDVEGKPSKEIRVNKAGKEYWVMAGYARNLEMSKHANVLIAFWDGLSKGTKNMIEQARKDKLLVFVIRY